MGLKKRYLFGAGVIAGASLLLFRKREQSTQTDALRDYLAHLDQDPSPDAAKDPDEVGLTKLLGQRDHRIVPFQFEVRGVSIRQIPFTKRP